MGYRPVVQIGLALDGETYLVLHYQPFRRISGAATTAGDIERVPRDEFRNSCKDRILASLDGFLPREVPDSEMKRLGLKGQKPLQRAHRVVSIQLGSPSAADDVAELAANHLHRDGTIEGCDPGDRVQVQREEGNDAFLAALDKAFSRCRGYQKL